MSESKRILGGDARFSELMWRLHASGLGKSVSASEWEEVEDFIDKNTMTEREFNQKEYDFGYKAGVDQTRLSIKEMLLAEAAEKFKVARDEEAKFIRRLANLIPE